MIVTLLTLCVQARASYAIRLDTESNRVWNMVSLGGVQ